MSTQDEFLKLLNSKDGPDVAQYKLLRGPGHPLDMDLDHLSLNPIKADLEKPSMAEGFGMTD